MPNRHGCTVEKFWSTSPKSLISLKVYVDDFALSFRFNRKEHTQDMITMKVANAYRAMESAIQGCGANFAQKKGSAKGRVVASDDTTSKKIVEELNRERCDEECPNDCKVCPNRNVEQRNGITILGVDYAAGKPVTHAKMRERLKKAEDKGNKILTYARKGGWRANQ